MLDSVAKYMWNIAGDWAYTEWIWNMQNAGHYNDLHTLMTAFLLLNFLSSFTINFQRHKDKNWELMRCLPTLICEAMSYLLFLLECRTRREGNIGTNCIFVRVYFYWLVFLWVTCLKQDRDTWKRTKSLCILTPAEDYCTCVQGRQGPQCSQTWSLNRTDGWGHRRVLLQDSLPSQSFTAGKLLQLMENEEIWKLSASENMRKNGQFLLTCTWKGKLHEKDETGDGGWQRNIKMFPPAFYMQWREGWERTGGQTWSSAAPFPMGLQKWENWL